MTKDNEERLLNDVRIAKDDLHVLKERIIGDPFAKPKPIRGLVDVVDLHDLELYGNVERQHVGLKPRLESLEHELLALKAAYKSDRRWILTTASGLSTGIGLAWYAAQLWFGK